MEQPFLVLTVKLKAISANYLLGISSVKGYGIYPEVGGLTGRCQGRCCKGITGSALLPGEKEESRWGGMLLSPLCMCLRGSSACLQHLTSGCHCPQLQQEFLKSTAGTVRGANTVKYFQNDSFPRATFIKYIKDQIKILITVCVYRLART